MLRHQEVAMPQNQRKPKATLTPLPAIGVLPEHHALLMAEAEKRGITLYKLVQDAIVDLIEDIEDIEIIEQRLADDDGVRYTLEDLKADLREPNAA
jgi:hypothetical protein